MAEQRTTPGVQVALSIAGSDPSGGAGIQADLKTFSAMNVFGTAVVTAVTAQNTTGVKASQTIDPDMVDAQISAVASDIEVDATKTGMLGSAAVVATVAKAVSRHNLFPLVVDPVMVAKSGARLVDDETMQAIAKKLLPLAAVVTPNRYEAARLIGRSEPINDGHAAAEAAREICRKHKARACIVKGIRQEDEHEGQAVDYYFDGSEVHEITSAWRLTDNLHGAGCVFSAALAGALALDEAIGDAVETAKIVVSEAIRQTTSLGHGNAPVNPLAYMAVKKK